MPVPFSEQVILLVDDEESSRAMVRQMLRRIGFADVLVAVDGYRAVELLAQHPNVTAVLTDFRMPGMHGLQLLQAIRTGKTAAARNLPCAMLTSYAERHLVGTAIILDVDTFLAKPVAIDVLARHLGRMFQYRFEPLNVDVYTAVDVDNVAPHLTGGVAVQPMEAAPADDELASSLPLSDEDDGLADLPPQAPLPEPPKEQAARAEPPAPKPEAPAAKPPAKPTAKPAAKPEAPAAPKPGSRLGRSEAPPTGRMVKVPLNEVPENAVLARSIVGAGGTLLLAAGTPFKQRYLKRLEELSSIAAGVEEVWIIDTSPGRG